MIEVVGRLAPRVIRRVEAVDLTGKTRQKQAVADAIVASAASNKPSEAIMK
jgi:hypothetical protein